MASMIGGMILKTDLSLEGLSARCVRAEGVFFHPAGMHGVFERGIVLIEWEM